MPGSPVFIMVVTISLDRQTLKAIWLVLNILKIGQERRKEFEILYKKQEFDLSETSLAWLKWSRHRYYVKWSVNLKTLPKTPQFRKIWPSRRNRSIPTACHAVGIDLFLRLGEVLRRNNKRSGIFSLIILLISFRFLHGNE